MGYMESIVAPVWLLVSAAILWLKFIMNTTKGPKNVPHGMVFDRERIQTLVCARCSFVKFTTIVAQQPSSLEVCECAVYEPLLKHEGLKVSEVNHVWAKFKGYMVETGGCVGVPWKAHGLVPQSVMAARLGTRPFHDQFGSNLFDGLVLGCGCSGPLIGGHTELVTFRGSDHQTMVPCRVNLAGVPNSDVSPLQMVGDFQKQTLKVCLFILNFTPYTQMLVEHFHGGHFGFTRHLGYLAEAADMKQLTMQVLSLQWESLVVKHQRRDPRPHGGPGCPEKGRLTTTIYYPILLGSKCKWLFLVDLSSLIFGYVILGWLRLRLFDWAGQRCQRLFQRSWLLVRFFRGPETCLFWVINDKWNTLL